MIQSHTLAGDLKIRKMEKSLRKEEYICLTDSGLHFFTIGEALALTPLEEKYLER